MTAKAKQDKGGPQTDKGRPLPTHAGRAFTDLRHAYGLSRRLLARMLGVPGATLPKWEKGVALPDAACLEKVRRVRRILEGLARVMKKNFIVTWLTSPNEACAGRAPVDLLEKGHYEAVEDLVYFLEAGEPV